MKNPKVDELFQKLQNQLHALRVRDTIFSGRTLWEYEKMFDLKINSIKDKRVLDCPAGASSFAFEAKKLGINVIACDEIYSRNLSQLKLLGEFEIELTRQRTKLHHQIYNWDLYRSIPNLIKYRRKALKNFLKDFSDSIGSTYIHGNLSQLPFKDRTFEMVLSANLLFSYEDELDYAFHIKAIREMLRVSKQEVRIFPAEKAHGPPKFLGRILKELKRDGVSATITTTTYEYVKGINKMLLLSKN